MIQQPRFTSHAEQQAMLGSAAALDPVKFPRRAALAKAREKHLPRPVMATQQAQRDRITPIVAELAKTMSISQVEKETGHSRTLLQRIAAENGFAFAQMRPGRPSLKEVVDTYLQEPCDG